MAVWLTRAGSHGEFEQKFIQESRVYVTWDELDVDLSKLPNRDALTAKMTAIYPDAKPKKVMNHVSQIWPFAHEMKKGDLVVLPLKTQPAINFGEITGDYRFEPKGPNPFFHWRSVKWIAEAVPRTNFGQDLLYTMGAFLTICRVQRNNAEARINKMRENGWRAETIAAVIGKAGTEDEEELEGSDLDELAQDQIAQLDDDIKAELPLKRIWTVTAKEE